MLKDELKKIVTEELKINEEVITDNTSFSRDLAINSLAILKLICRIENEYDIDIDEDQIDLLDNIGTAYKYINTLIEEKK